MVVVVKATIVCVYVCLCVCEVGGVGIETVVALGYISRTILRHASLALICQRDVVVWSVHEQGMAMVHDLFSPQEMT